LFQARVLESVRFVDDDELDVGKAASPKSGSPSSVGRSSDEGVEFMAKPAELAFNLASRDDNLGSPEDGVREVFCDRSWWVVVGIFAAPMEPGEIHGDGVPPGVLARGKGLAYAGWSVAESDVAVAPNCVGELGESLTFLGDQERGGGLVTHRGSA
jgi:hypothetical protein